MISIDCTHPDLEEFINLKSDLNLCTEANISVRVSDDFMKAVEEGRDWNLRAYASNNNFGVYGFKQVPLTNPRTGV